MCLWDPGKPVIEISLDPGVLSPGCLGDVNDGRNVSVVCFLQCRQIPCAGGRRLLGSLSFLRHWMEALEALGALGAMALEVCVTSEIPPPVPGPWTDHLAGPHSLAWAGWLDQWAGWLVEHLPSGWLAEPELLAGWLTEPSHGSWLV